MIDASREASIGTQNKIETANSTRGGEELWSTGGEARVCMSNTLLLDAPGLASGWSRGYATALQDAFVSALRSVSPAEPDMINP